MQLKHGAIYLFNQVINQHEPIIIEARCNISTCGDEYWFTSQDGTELYGRPVKRLRDGDDSFKHNDVKPPLMTFEAESRNEK